MNWEKVLKPSAQKIKIFFVIVFIGHLIASLTLGRLVDWTDRGFGFFESITDVTFLINFVFSPLTQLTVLLHSYLWFEGILQSVFSALVGTIDLLWLYTVGSFIGYVKKRQKNGRQNN